jgi:hypothetical protein
MSSLTGANFPETTKKFAALKLELFQILLQNIIILRAVIEIAISLFSFSGTYNCYFPIKEAINSRHICGEFAASFIFKD